MPTCVRTDGFSTGTARRRRDAPLYSGQGVAAARGQNQLFGILVRRQLRLVVQHQRRDRRLQCPGGRAVQEGSQQKIRSGPGTLRGPRDGRAQLHQSEQRRQVRVTYYIFRDAVALTYRRAVAMTRTYGGDVRACHKLLMFLQKGRIKKRETFHGPSKF